jgi:chemotaxis protein CheD
MEIYTSESLHGPGTRIKVGIADYAVGGEETTLVTSGLGSCVGIALWDARGGVAGLAHAMLPSAAEVDDADPNEAKYVDAAIPALLAEMEREGAERGRIEAKLAGGSKMFDFTESTGSIGRRNAEAARRHLAASSIDLVAEDVGGGHGRSLELAGDTGELTVRSADHEEYVL